MVVLATLEPSPSVDVPVNNDCPELHSAVAYWVDLLLKYDRNTPLWKIQTFRDQLFKGIKRRIDGHWYPDNPDRGQGYRALLCAERVDGLLLEALYRAGLADVDLRPLDQHLVMYIDPGNVSLRVSPSHAHGRRAETTLTVFPTPSSSSPTHLHSVSPRSTTPPPGYYNIQQQVKVAA